MPIPTHPERSGLELYFWPEDADGASAIPGDARWRLVCKTDDSVVQDWTIVTPAAEVFVDVPGTLTAMRDRNNQRELWCVYFVCNYDGAREYSVEADFYLTRAKRY